MGGGQAGVQAAASLRQLGYDGPITLVGDEPGPPYQRPPLSKSYLTGDVEAAGLRLRPGNFFTSKKIGLLAEERVTAIERADRRVLLRSGARLGYDHLILATGSRHRVLQVPGADLDGVASLRTLAEAEALKPLLAAASDIVVIGAGFIGLEFAAVATRAGKRVTIIEIAPRPLARALSSEMSAVFAAAHESWGARLVMGTGVRRITGTGRVTGVETNAGEIFAADLVLVGIGAVANSELAAAAGLAVERGIMVDATLATEDPAISAIGDCALIPSAYSAGVTRLESVQNAVDSAKCAALRIVGRPTPYTDVPWFWSDQGPLKLQIVGLTTDHDSTVMRGDRESGAFSVFCFQGERLLGVESVNQTADHMAGRKLLLARAPITRAQAGDLGFDLKAAAAA